MQGTLVTDLLVVLAAGLLAALVCRWLRISVLVGYLLVGVLVGSGVLGWVSEEHHDLEYLAEAGVFMLLFAIGLEFSLDELLRLGRNLLIGGGAQMLLVAVPIAGILSVFGMSWQSAVLIAAAVSFSSTVLIFKALTEWGHSSLPHGRRAIGILLFQDAALIPLLLMVPLLTGSGEQAGLRAYALLVATSVLFVVGVLGLRYLLDKWIIPLFASYRSPELVVLLTLVSLGTVTYVAYSVGLPPAIGAFAAGLIFGGNRWTKQIDALLLPFRETFAAVFFVSLGLLLDPRVLMAEPFFMLGALIAVVVIKAGAAIIALRLTGLAWRTSTGMGIGLAHIGEFALVLVMLGWESGVIERMDYQRIVAISIGSLILTPLLLKTGLRWTQVDHDLDAETLSKRRLTESGQHALVIGAGPIGRLLSSRLETAGKDVCMIDLSQINLHPFAQQGFRTIVGDATLPEVLALAHADCASIAVVSVPKDEAAILIVENLRKVNSQAFVLVRCRFQVNCAKLRKAGADRVVSEEAQASERLLLLLDEFDRHETEFRETKKKSAS